MRHVLIIALFFMFNMTISAQDDTVLMPDDLPEPIYIGERLVMYLAEPHQFAWLDNETLVFAPYNDRTTGDEEHLNLGYQYDLTSDTLTQLDYNPFRATMSDEYRDWYQVHSSAIIYRQPYPLYDDTFHRILYLSRLHGICGNECSSSIIMTGVFDGQTEEELNFTDSYMPISLNDWGSETIFWGRNNTAIIQVRVVYGQGDNIYYINLGTGEDEHIPNGLFNLSDRILAMTDDGNYTAFSSNYDPNDYLSIGQKLYLWQAPYHDEHCNCTYDGQFISVIEPINPISDLDVYFAGVGFVDDDTILYIGELGLMRHNLLTGISSIIDPELNVGWIRTAVFSPDNQHVAITTEQGLYVLPLDIE